MSCSNCDCEECEESRCMNDDDEEEDTSFGRLPPAPPLALTPDLMRSAMNQTFDKHPNVRINMPAMQVMMIQKLPGITPGNYSEACEMVRDFLLSQSYQGVITITKGKDGGIKMANIDEPVKAPIEVKRTIAGPVYSVGALPLQNASSAPAINNHTCPHCGNTSCSKSERSCWKCGGSL